MSSFVDIIRRELADEPRNGAEIGVSKGQTSAALLRAFPGLTLYMVDAWATYPESHPYRKSGDGHSKLTVEQQAEHKRLAIEATNFAAKRREIVHTTSLEASWRFADRRLDFVIEDCDHTFAAVAMNLRLWWPKLRPGGLLVLDDVGHPRDRRGLFGVTKAMEGFAEEVGVVAHKNESIQKGWMLKPKENE